MPRFKVCLWCHTIGGDCSIVFEVTRSYGSPAPVRGANHECAALTGDSRAVHMSLMRRAVMRNCAQLIGISMHVSHCLDVTSQLMPTMEAGPSSCNIAPSSRKISSMNIVVNAKFGILCIQEYTNPHFHCISTSSSNWAPSTIHITSL